MNFSLLVRFAVAIPVAVLLSGCHVSSHKNGNSKDVDIGTPFGSMQVKTNDDANTSSLGLTAYPGAVAIKDDGDNDSANVNMNFGSFHLGVVARALQTGDSQDKVIAFYRKDLGRFGDIIQCKGNSSVGTPTHTSLGLTCSDNDHHRVSHDSDGEFELRAGSPLHQHIVSIETKNGGTRIGLVKLDLPAGVNGDKDDKEGN